MKSSARRPRKCAHTKSFENKLYIDNYTFLSKSKPPLRSRCYGAPHPPKKRIILALWKTWHECAFTVVVKFSPTGISQRFLEQVPFGGAFNRMSFLDRSNSGGGLNLTTMVSKNHLPTKTNPPKSRIKEEIMKWSVIWIKLCFISTNYTLKHFLVKWKFLNGVEELH